MMKPLFYSGLCLFILTGHCVAQELPKPAPNPVKKLEARFEPAEAKPGQQVTLKIELKLEDGWYTYPTRQLETNAKLFVSKISLPRDGVVQFSGKIKEPANPKIRIIEELDIKEFHTYPGGGVWECHAIVAPNATPGSESVKVGFRIVAVNATGCCNPPKQVSLEATIKIAGEPASEKK